jgi:DNA-binding NarL/FixJ family response regulator
MTSLEAKLSPAERRVLSELLDGQGNIAIARRLHRSDKTIKNQLAKIFAKTNTSSRLDLVVKIYKARLRSLRRAA